MAFLPVVCRMGLLISRVTNSSISILRRVQSYGFRVWPSPSPWAMPFFAIAYGFTHLLEFVVVWKPSYWFAEGDRILTAFASAITAALLPFCLPRIGTMIAHAEFFKGNKHPVLLATKSSGDTSADRNLAFNKALIASSPFAL